MKKERYVRYLFKLVNPHMPRSFVWKSQSDVELYKYIDDLYDRSQVPTGLVEQQGIASGHSYVDQPEQMHCIAISKEMLLAVLLGEFPLEVPMNSYFRVRENRGKVAPDQIASELADSGLQEAFHQAILKWVEEGKPLNIRDHIDWDKAKGFLRHGPSFKLEAAQAAGIQPSLEVGDAHKPPPAHESVISSKGDNIALEVISLVTTEGHPSYFIRREYHNNQLRAASTSWSIKGPWEAQA
ncbi:MAG: hypothetical protein F6K48_02930 [Okeania sp. SIO3H1]|nr:hypothetical protein [Okeania sp. SIO3H1]